MARRPRANNRANGRDAYDTEIVRNAAYFTAIRFAPRGETERHQFTSLSDAIEAAFKLRDHLNRPAMVYAVTAEGRDAHLSRTDWEKWLGVWKGVR